jgi:hypothetical protein
MLPKRRGLSCGVCAHCSALRELNSPRVRTARVVLPEPDNSDPEDGDEEEENVDGDKNDILAGLPDETDVRNVTSDLT